LKDVAFLKRMSSASWQTSLTVSFKVRLCCLFSGSIELIDAATVSLGRSKASDMQDGSDDDHDNSSSESGDSDIFDSDDAPTEKTRQGNSELEEYFFFIVEIIDRLYKASMAIRDPVVRNRSLKAAPFVDKDEHGIDRDIMFENLQLLSLCTR